jgi:hypothetical protein
VPTPKSQTCGWPLSEPAAVRLGFASRFGGGVRENWTIVFIKAGHDIVFRDSGSVSRETALRQAQAYLRQGGDVLRIIGPNGEVIVLNEIQHQTELTRRA